MAEEPPEDFSKLSIEDKVTHKSWKARVMGFEELTKLFKRIDDEKSPQFGPYIGLMKKFVIDSNVFAQEKALEATLAFVEFAAAAPKVSSDVVSGLVAKAFNGKPKVKQVALDICLMYIEIEKHDVVQEELMNGFKNKQPKIIAACTEALSTALKQFGAKVINIKLLVKAMPPLFDHRDKAVREAAKGLAVEMYRWLGPALKPTLEGALKPVQMKELSEECEKLPGMTARPERYLRSQMKKIQAEQAASQADGGDDDDDDSDSEDDDDEEDVGDIDPYDLLDPEDILSKIPKDFYDNLADPKWKVRKEAVEVVVPLATKPKLAPGNYGELVSAMKKLISKDSNVMVVALAANVVKGLAVGLRKGFTQYATVVIGSLLGKFKEKKQNVVVALREAVDAVYLTTSFGAIEEDVKGCLVDKNPSVKSETILFLARCFQQCTPAMMPKAMLKAFCPPLVQCLSDTTPVVRDAAAEALGTMLKVVGERTMGVFLDGVDDIKMAKVNEVKDKVELKPPPGADGKKGGGAKKSPKKKSEGGSKSKKKSGKKKGGDSEEEEAPEEIDPYDLLDPVNVLSQIPKDFYDSIADPKWKVRKEALEVVAPLAAKPKLAPGDYGELVAAMKKLISKDSNVMVVALAANVVKGLAVGLRKGFTQYATVVIGSLLGKFKEKKQNVVVALREAVDAVYLTTSFGAIEEDVKGCLVDKNPSVKSETILFLARCFQQCTPAMMPKAMLKAFCPPLVQCLSDTTPVVRDAAAEALGTMLKVVGERTMGVFLDGVDDIKMAKITEFKDKVELKVVVKPEKKASKSKKKKASEDVEEPSREQPPPTSKPKKKTSTKKPPVEEEKEEPKPPPSKRESKEGGTKPAKKGTTSKTSAKKTTGATKKGGKDANEEAGPPLTMGPTVQQRQKDEQSFKVLKWNFSAPRSEFVEQLKDQMQPCVSGALLTQLFHNDFKQHLAALGILKECITDPYPFKKEALNCVDLLLKWITLRFCDTNTTVNLKCLEFLAALFGLLVGERYRLSDYEAASFLPFLMIKSGDAKDAVRKEVRGLFYQICCVYPPPKVFGFVSDGLKTKNSRQRTECLEILGVMVQENGTAVCQPSPQKAVQQISTFIGEKDSTVRNAALNTLVVFYGHMGETLYKHVGKIPAKDMSMLEERIRRAAKRSTPPESVPPPSKQQSSSELASKLAEEPRNEEKDPQSTIDSETLVGSSSDTFTKDPSPEPVQAQQPEPPPPTRRLRYDGPLKMDWSKYVYPKWEPIDVNSIPKPDLDSLGPEPVVPDLPTSRLLRDPPPSLSFSPKRMASTAAAVGYIISQIASSDNKASIAALKQMEEILSKPEHVELVIVQVDQLLRAILMQLRMNFTSQLQESATPEERSEVMHLGKRLTSCLLNTFSRRDYAAAARRDTLIEAERDIMNLLLNERLLQLEEVAQLNRSFNYLVYQLIENGDKNALFGSLMHVLLESLRQDGNPTKLTEMVMKCIWKLTKKLNTSLSEINVDQLLLDAHHFFVGYGKLTATSKPTDDKAYKTIKTVLFQLVTLLGTKVMDHLVLIENANQTGVYKYLSKAISKKRESGELVVEVATVKPGDVPQPKKVPQLVYIPIPGDLATRLANAVEKTTTKQQKRQGFRELYAITEDFPDFDLHAYVAANTLEFYQGYIKRGLSVVEYERECQAQNIEPEEHKIRDMMETEEYKAALKRAENARKEIQRLGQAESDGVLSEGRPRLEKKVNSTTAVDGGLKVPKTRSIPSSRPAARQLQQPSNFNLQSLKQRLDKLKNAS